MPSGFLNNIQADSPVDLSAAWKGVDRGDRRLIDDQIRGVQQALVQSLLRGVVGTWMTLDPGATRDGAAGDCVCLSLASNRADVVTLAVTATLAASGGVFGVLTGAYTRGSLCFIATLGALPPSITGLEATPGDAQFVRVDPATARCERVASLGGGDFQVGRVDAIGQMFIQRTPAASGGGGGGGGVTGPGSATVNAFALWSASDGSAIKNSPYTGHADGSVSAATDVTVKSYADALILTATVTKKNHSNSPYSLAATDSTLHLDTSTGLIQVSLPNPTFKRSVLIKDSGFAASTNPITLHRFGSEKIEGVALDRNLPVSGGAWLVYSDGTDYFVAGP